MFKIIPVVQKGNYFDGFLYLDKEQIGAIGNDKEGIYINLKRKLSVKETIELLKTINGVNIEFSELEILIQYIK